MTYHRVNKVPKHFDETEPVAPVRMPMVDVGDGQMDVVSRLLKDRILLLGTQVSYQLLHVVPVFD